MKSNIKYIVWDVDGTLYRSTPELSRALQDKLTTHIQQVWGKPFEELKNLYHTRKQRYKSSTNTSVSMVFEPAFNIINYLESDTAYANYIHTDERLIQLFKNLAGYKHVAYRNGTSQKTREIITSLGLNETVFTNIWGVVSQIGIAKPTELAVDGIRTDLFRRFGNYSGIIEEDQIDAFSSQILMVGDRAEVDLEPAKKCGMQTALVWNTKPQDSSYIDYILPTVYDLPSIFV